MFALNLKIVTFISAHASKGNRFANEFGSDFGAEGYGRLGMPRSFHRVEKPPATQL